MSGPALAYSYFYPFESILGNEYIFSRTATRKQANQSNGLRLSTFHEQDGSPYFFQGELVDPYVVAKHLQALVYYVRTLFHEYVDAATRALADPIITAHEDFLRFEVFSGCCSVYARADLMPQAIRGKTLGCGTTNVDFNPTMVAALGKVRASDDLTFSVGADEFVLEQLEDRVVEKKVQLPLRWLKGLVAATSYGEKLECRHEISAAHATRFLRSLPRNPDKRSRWYVQKAGATLRLSQRESPQCVPAGGIHRLRPLEDLIRFAKCLRVYGSNEVDASGWEIDCGSVRFSVIMTHDVWRGFSGEGQGLEAMARDLPKQVQTGTSRLLKWQSIINPSDSKSRLTEHELEAGLAFMSSQGKVGFDMASGHFFHRELPFDLTMVAKLQPRLQSAQKLLDKECVQPRQGTNDWYEVKSTETTHAVQLSDSMFKCTCPWYAKHQNRRGPCKHVLAVQMYLNRKNPAS